MIESSDRSLAPQLYAVTLNFVKKKSIENHEQDAAFSDLRTLLLTEFEEVNSKLTRLLDAPLQSAFIHLQTALNCVEHNSLVDASHFFRLCHEKSVDAFASSESFKNKCNATRLRIICTLYLNGYFSETGNMDLIKSECKDAVDRLGAEPEVRAAFRDQTKIIWFSSASKKAKVNVLNEISDLIKYVDFLVGANLPEEKVSSQVHVGFSSYQTNFMVSALSIKKLFEVYGQVLKVEMCQKQVLEVNASAHLQSGYAIVHFASTSEGVESAVRAIEAIQKLTINMVTYDCHMVNNLRILCLKYANNALVRPPIGSSMEKDHVQSYLLQRNNASETSSVSTSTTRASIGSISADSDCGSVDNFSLSESNISSGLVVPVKAQIPVNRGEKVGIAELECFRENNLVKDCVILLGLENCGKTSFIDFLLNRESCAKGRTDECTVHVSSTGFYLLDTPGLSLSWDTNSSVMRKIKEYLLSNKLNAFCVLVFQSSQFLDHAMVKSKEILTLAKVNFGTIPNDCFFIVNVSGEKLRTSAIVKLCEELQVKYFDLGKVDAGKFAESKRSGISSLMNESQRVNLLCAREKKCFVLLAVQGCQKSKLVSSAYFGSLINYSSRGDCVVKFSEKLNLFLIDCPCFSTIDAADNDEILFNLELLMSAFKITGVLVFHSNQFAEVGLWRLRLLCRWSRELIPLTTSQVIMVNASGSRYKTSTIVRCCKELNCKYFYLPIDGNFAFQKGIEIDSLMAHLTAISETNQAEDCTMNHSCHSTPWVSSESPRQGTISLFKLKKYDLVPLFTEWLTQPEYTFLYNAFGKADRKSVHGLMAECPTKFQDFFVSLKDTIQAYGLWKAVCGGKIVYTDSLRKKMLRVKATIGQIADSYSEERRRQYFYIACNFEKIIIDIPLMDRMGFMRRFVSDLMSGAVNIVHLDLSGVVTTQPDLYVSKLHNLSELVIDSPSRKVLCCIVVHARKLRSLKLKGSRLTSKDLGILGFHGPSLEEYSTSAGNNSDSALRALLWHRGSRLRLLSLDRGTGITDQLCSDLVASNSLLSSLSFALCDLISDSGLQYVFDNLPTLQSMSFWHNCSTSSASLLQCIEKCTGLTSLRFENLKYVSPRSDVIPMCGCVNLTSIKLRDCSLTDSVLRTLIFSQTDKLTSLDISRNTDLTAVALADVMTSLRHLKDLNISYCSKANNAVALQIAQYCSNLTTVELSNCQLITEEGVTAILRSCLQITSLSIEYLPNCNIVDVIDCIITERLQLRKVRVSNSTGENCTCHESRLLEFRPSMMYRC